MANPTMTLWIAMSFPIRFLQLRKDNDLTQQGMADAIGIHVTQVKRYEAGTSQPSLEILKKIAVTFSITTDELIFEDSERGPSDDLQMQFEALSQFDKEEKKIAKAVLDSLILKHTANRLAG
ncbi:helix-turn-helix domain-containing protein [Porticoccus sp. GXU_MW_L64]